MILDHALNKELNHMYLMIGNGQVAQKDHIGAKQEGFQTGLDDLLSFLQGSCFQVLEEA